MHAIALSNLPSIQHGAPEVLTHTDAAKTKKNKSKSPLFKKITCACAPKWYLFFLLTKGILFWMDRQTGTVYKNKNR
jgi:hypothetical protein